MPKLDYERFGTAK